MIRVNESSMWFKHKGGTGDIDMEADVVHTSRVDNYGILLIL